MSITIGVGEVKTTSTKFKWEIKNFCTSCEKMGDKLESPIFSTSTNKWFLSLYPKGDSEVSKDYLSIFLYHANETQIEADAQIIILNNKNNEVTKLVLGKVVYKQSQSWGYSNFVKRSLIINEANDVLVNDTLTILCEIIAEETIQDSGPMKDTQMKMIECQLTRLKEFDDYEKLLENEKFSDVTFVVDDKKLRLHKSILTNKSAVFAAMFEHNMKEKNENIVEIKDIKYKVFKELLRFIYVGKVNEIEKSAANLLIAAEKYALEGLKIICEKCLCGKLNCNNALKYLKMADLHNAPILKAQSINFIVTNVKNIVKQPEFKLLDELHSDVTRELFLALAKAS